MVRRLEEVLMRNKRPESEEVLNLISALSHQVSHFLAGSRGHKRYYTERLMKSKNVLSQLEEKATDEALRTKSGELSKKLDEVIPEEPVNLELLDEIEKLLGEVKGTKHQLRKQ